MTWATPAEVAYVVRIRLDSVWRAVREGRYRAKNLSGRSERPTYRIAVDEDGFPLPEKK